MLDTKVQTQLTDATADLMRACSLATVRAANASANQWMTIWSDMLRRSARRPSWYGGGWVTMPFFGWNSAAAAWNPYEGWAAWSEACMPLPYAPQHGASPSSVAPQATLTVDPAFSSYRSSGGHAVAQVVIS